ncbi:hypothetical protein GCM10023324_16820 [Streptomyces youssoufiensis]
MDYVRLMDATWQALYATTAGRERVLAGLSASERALLGPASTGPGFQIEQVRRRQALANVLHTSFPVTFFTFFARAGAEGVQAFLESPPWRGRAPQPGSAFPPLATTSAAFSDFVRHSDWLSAQEGWVGEAFRFEDDFLFGGGVPRPATDGAGPATPRLVDGAWVTEASFDVPAFAKLLHAAAESNPWPEALFLVKRRPLPFAVLCVPDGERVRRVTLRGDQVLNLRWLWDEEVPAPDGVLGTLDYQRALASGVVHA